MDAFLASLDLTYADITAYLGLAAIGLLSLNVVLGILVSIQFKPEKYWPYKKIPFFDLHNWTGYVALFVALIHPASLLLSASTKFRLFDILLPYKAPYQALENSIGALALYGLIFVVMTAYLRNRFSFRFWKKLHYVSYAVFIFVFYHGVFTDPSLKDLPIDYLDGGKVFTEGAFLLVSAMIAWRIQVSRIKKNVFRGGLVVQDIKVEAPGVKTFILAPLGGGEIPFSYKAGQYVNFKIQSGGKRLLRSYSMTSEPSQTSSISIAIKLALGAGSKFFHDEVQVGNTLDVNAPFGDFTFSGRSKSLLLIAGGIGVTPILSTLRGLAEKNWQRPILLIYCARTKEDLAFREEIEALKAKLPKFRAEYLLSQEKLNEPHFKFGLPSCEILKSILHEERYKRVHLCGPDLMMNLVTEGLVSTGYRKHQIHTESFGAAAPPPVLFSTTKAVCKVEGLTEDFVIPEGVTILDALLDAGVEINSSCRKGSCGACKIRLTKGQTKQSIEGFLSASDVKNGYVLSCVGYCQSPEIEISIEN